MVRGGELIKLAGYGMATLDYDVPVTAGTVFSIWHDTGPLGRRSEQAGHAERLSPSTCRNQPSSWFHLVKFRLKSFPYAPFYTFRKMRLRYSSHTGTKQTAVKLIE